MIRRRSCHQKNKRLSELLARKLQWSSLVAEATCPFSPFSTLTTNTAINWTQWSLIKWAKTYILSFIDLFLRMTITHTTEASATDCFGLLFTTCHSTFRLATMTRKLSVSNGARTSEWTICSLSTRLETVALKISSGFMTITWCFVDRLCALWNPALMWV